MGTCVLYKEGWHFPFFLFAVFNSTLEDWRMHRFLLSSVSVLSEVFWINFAKLLIARDWKNHSSLGVYVLSCAELRAHRWASSWWPGEILAPVHPQGILRKTNFPNGEDSLVCMKPGKVPGSTMVSVRAQGGHSFIQQKVLGPLRHQGICMLRYKRRQGGPCFHRVCSRVGQTDIN